MPFFKKLFVNIIREENATVTAGNAATTPLKRR
jgi:hypothetical protein